MIDRTREKAIAIVGPSQLCALNADGLAVVEASELLRLTEGVRSVGQIQLGLHAMAERLHALEEWRAEQEPEPEEHGPWDGDVLGSMRRLVADLQSELEAAKREREVVIAQAAVLMHERDDLAGQLRALRTDHELLIEAHGKSCDARAHLTAECEEARAELAALAANILASNTADTARLLDVVRAAQRIRRVLKREYRDPAEFALAARGLGDAIDAYERDPGGYER